MKSFQTPPWRAATHHVKDPNARDETKNTSIVNACNQMIAIASPNATFSINILVQLDKNKSCLTIKFL